MCNESSLKSYAVMNCLDEIILVNLIRILKNGKIIRIRINISAKVSYQLILAILI